LYLEGILVKIDRNEIAAGYLSILELLTLLKVPKKVEIIYKLDGLASNSSNAINASVNLNFNYNDYSYSVKATETSKGIEKLYGYPFTDQEMDTIINEVAKSVVAQIKSKVGEL
jgi:hypothetical protein